MYIQFRMMRIDSVQSMPPFFFGQLPDTFGKLISRNVYVIGMLSFGLRGSDSISERDNMN